MTKIPFVNQILTKSVKQSQIFVKPPNFIIYYQNMSNNFLKFDQI